MDDDQRIEVYQLTLSQFDESEKSMLLTSLLDIMYDGNYEVIINYLDQMKTAYKVLEN